MARVKRQNAYANVKCSECSAKLSRRPLRPKDYKAIAHFFCDKECKGLWQRRQKPVDEAWLRQKYLVEGLSAPDIACIVGRNSKGVWQWLHDYGIPTRPRGSDVRQHFAIGQPNAFAGKKHTEATRARLKQIAIADGRVPFKKENGPPWKGKGGPGHPSWKGGLTPERQAFYASNEWTEAVKKVWRKSDARCERCKKHHNTEVSRGKFHIHHIVSFMVRELKADPSNLALLCGTCHKFVHSKANTGKEFIKGQADGR